MPIELCPVSLSDPETQKRAELFLRLVQVVAALRNPNGGCPWDLEQSHDSLKPYLIEEAYEVLDAIDTRSTKLPDELGDVLLQVMLHSQIGSEENHFSIDDVVHAVTEKLIRRHPHVFGDQEAKDSKEVLKNWEQRKQSELADGVSILDGVPRAMPALLRAQRVGDKAARVGFEWSTVEEIRDKVTEELGEFLNEALDPNANPERVQDELGDVLFSLSQLSRRLGYTAEDLLQRATDKFSRRFKEVERRATPSMKECTLEELDRLWNEVKKEEKR
jgi:MazG family protein